LGACHGLGTEPFLEGLDIDAVKECQARVCHENLISAIANGFVNQQRKMRREVENPIPGELSQPTCKDHLFKM
jgi:hypothetical protein